MVKRIFAGVAAAVALIGFSGPAFAGGTFTRGDSQTTVTGNVEQWGNYTTTTDGFQLSTGITTLLQGDCDNFLTEVDTFKATVNTHTVETGGSNMSGTILTNSWTQTEGFVPFVGPMSVGN
jgi:hypothetical protein